MKAKKEKKRDLRLSGKEELVLRTLLNRKLYGLDIIKTIEGASKGKRSIGFGSLYPILHGLEKKGIVTAEWGEETPAEREGARRRYYRITGLGRTALTEAEELRKGLATWNLVWQRS